MAEQSGGEKTLPASPRKKEQAREKGNVAKSQDLNAAALLLVAFVTFSALGPALFDRMMTTTRHYISESSAFLNVKPDLQAILIQVLQIIAPVLLPIMLLFLLGSVAINVSQFGLLISTKALIPKFSKLNPITGFQRFVSIRTFVELIKSILKLTLISLIVWFSMRAWLPDILSLIHMSPGDGSAAVWGFVLTVWWRVALAMLLLGLFDFAFQRWQHERDLMMTQQEARQELKEMEGDPKIKQRVRQIQRQIAFQRMMGEVPEADVVVTNPTTYAVALRYDKNTMPAPTVTAKGARLVAERIRTLAVENDVPIVERPELARALYRTVEIGQPVSEELFRAIAELLAYVYQIDRRESKIRERATENMAATAVA